MVSELLEAYAQGHRYALVEDPWEVVASCKTRAGAEKLHTQLRTHPRIVKIADQVISIICCNTGGYGDHPVQRNEDGSIDPSKSIFNPNQYGMGWPMPLDRITTLARLIEDESKPKP